MRLELLAASCKLFFRRPAEMQHMLGRLLEQAVSDASFTDTRYTRYTRYTRAGDFRRELHRHLLHPLHPLHPSRRSPTRASPTPVPLVTLLHPLHPEQAISDASFTDVHDRAMMYYRLLQFDVGEASRVLSKASQVTAE